MDPIIWSVLCCFVMVVLVALEMFTPSFGLLTVLAVCCIAGSIALAFKSSPTAGFIMIGVNLTLFPIAVFAGMQFIRRSPLTLDDAIQAYSPDLPPETRKVHELVGQRGVALTDLRPSGAAQVGEKRIDVVTEGKFVNKGAALKVLKVEGAIILVEEIEATAATDTPEVQPTEEKSA